MFVFKLEKVRDDRVVSLTHSLINIKSMANTYFGRIGQIKRELEKISMTSCNKSTISPSSAKILILAIILQFLCDHSIVVWFELAHTYLISK